MAKRKDYDPINWNSSKGDAKLINAIVDRAVRDDLIKSDNALDVRMSLTACHLNGCPLRLVDLLAADAFTFAHDVLGINTHVSRDNGKLLNHFLPRLHSNLEDVRRKARRAA